MFLPKNGTLLSYKFHVSSNAEWGWWLEVILMSTGITIGSCVTIIHSKNVYSDLRKAQHSNTATQKLLSVTICASVWCYFFTMILTILHLFRPLSNYCFYWINIAGAGFVIAKMLMYITFVMRLYTVYNNPLYQYSLTVLKIICLIIIIYGLSISIAIVFTIFPYPYHGHPDYVVFCVYYVHPILPALLVLYDFMFGVGAMIAFINPLRKLIKSVLKVDISRRQKDELIPLIQSGVKYSILTTVSTVCTFMALIGVANGYTTFNPAAVITNMVCLTLMTPFYTKYQYYERLCCGAIKCSKQCLGYCYGYHQDVADITSDIERAQTDPDQGTSGEDINTSTTPQIEL